MREGNRQGIEKNKLQRHKLAKARASAPTLSLSFSLSLSPSLSLSRSVCEQEEEFVVTTFMATSLCAHS